MSETSESPTSQPPEVDDDLHNNPVTSEPNVDLHNYDNTESSESPTSSPPKVHQFHNSQDLGSDIVLWRRKQVNGVILLAASATWIMMDVFQYNFITLLSWLTIALLSCFFFWGTMHRFLNKEAPDLSEFEISEETATEHAKLLRQRAEEGIRLMFHVGAEREWFVFAGVVFSLYFTSLLPKHLDFLSLCIIGIVGAMSVPIMYVKNEGRIREAAGSVRKRSRRLNVMIEDKFQKMKNKIGGKHKVVKEKKTE